MWRQRFAAAGEPAEVDDSPNSCSYRGASEIAGRAPVHVRERPSSIHRMYEVVRGANADQRPIEGCLVETVASHDLCAPAACCHSRRVSSETSDGVAAFLERTKKAAAD